MSVSSRGSHGEPQFVSSGNLPTFPADLTEVSNFARLVGNRKVGTSSERTALTGSALWNGLEFHETDTGLSYHRQAGGWIRQPSGLNGIILKSGVSNVTTNGSGDGSISFPSAFPAQFTFALMQDALASMGPGAIDYRVNIAASTTTTLNFRAYNSVGDALPNYALRVAWLAFGQ